VTRPYRSDIPYARASLTQIANDLRHVPEQTREHLADRIDKVVRDHMWSHTPDHRAPRKSVTTPKKKAEGVRLKEEFPNASLLELGIAVGMNPGRLSEAWHAKKKRERGPG